MSFISNSKSNSCAMCHIESAICVFVLGISVCLVSHSLSVAVYIGLSVSLYPSLSVSLPVKISLSDSFCICISVSDFLAVTHSTICLLSLIVSPSSCLHQSNYSYLCSIILHHLIFPSSISRAVISILPQS